MSEVRNAVVDAVRPLKKARGLKQVENPYGDTCTHVITWGYVAESQLAFDGDFVFCYPDQVDQVVDILKDYQEVDGICVCKFTLEKYISKGEEQTV
jgi:hypothetical protein